MMVKQMCYGVQCVVLLAATFWTSAFGQETPDPSAIREDMLKGLTVSCSESRAEAFAAEHGEAALPVLSQMFEENLEPGVRARVAFHIGKIGKADSLEQLVRFLEKPFPAAMENETYTDYWSVMAAVGFIGTPQALDYLKMLASKDYWVKRAGERSDVPRISWYGTIWDAAKTQERLRCDAILALGASGKPQARTILDDLSASSDDPTIRAEIDSKIAECKLRESGARGKPLPKDAAQVVMTYHPPKERR